jgi:hypothetical protein
MTNATLKAGHGYYNIQRHPYGGEFHRADGNTIVELTGQTDPELGVEFLLCGEKAAAANTLAVDLPALQKPWLHTVADKGRLRNAPL